MRKNGLYLKNTNKPYKLPNPRERNLKQHK